jgi:hypothetical protein
MALTNVDLDRIDGNSGSLANVSTSALNGGPLAGTRNRIINGDMRIDQRNAGASANPSTGSYTLDRWFGGGVHDGVLAFQRVADGPTGFVNSLRVTVSTADSSLGATQYARVGQQIEGFNVSDFAAGTASAATITFSFWVKSSLTGTFGGYISNVDETRIYVFQYTINAASTWEQKTVTLTLATNGTWATDNTTGLRAFFSLGAGSNYINTANTWLTSYAQQASGNVNVLNTLNATWQITGVQLEAGTVATPFERRSYGQELTLCQRYYYRVVSNVADNNYARLSIFGQCANSTTAFAEVLFPVSMRTNPTSLQTTGTANNYSLFNSAGSGVVATALAFNAGSAHSGEVIVTVASGLVAGNATVLIANNNTTAYLGWSAEL